MIQRNTAADNMQMNLFIVLQQAGRFHDGLHGLQLSHITGKEEINLFLFFGACRNIVEQVLRILGKVPKFFVTQLQNLVKVGGKAAGGYQNIICPAVNSAGNAQKQIVNC